MANSFMEQAAKAYRDKADVLRKDLIKFMSKNLPWWRCEIQVVYLGVHHISVACKVIRRGDYQKHRARILASQEEVDRDEIRIRQFLEEWCSNHNITAPTARDLSGHPGSMQVTAMLLIYDLSKEIPRDN